MFGQDFLVDARLVVEPLLVRGGEQAAKVAVPDTRLRQQDQMEIAAALKVVAARRLGSIGALARREVGLASDNGFDPVLPGLEEEFDRAIDLLATGLLVVDDLTSVVTPLPDTLAAFEELRAGRIMKALIAPN